MASKLILSLLVLAVYCSLKVDAQWDGPTWQAKIGCFFNQYDLNDDGLVDAQDSTDLYNAFAPYPVNQQLVTGLLAAMWKALFVGDPLATEDVTNLITSLSTTGEGVMQGDVLAFTPAYLQLLDTNHDQVLQNTEWYFYLVTAQKLNPVNVNNGFTIFDTNKNGVLDQGEFTGGWIQYFTTSDPSNAFNNVLCNVS